MASAKLKRYRRKKFLVNIGTVLFLGFLMVSLIISLMMVHAINSLPDVRKLLTEGVEPVGTSRIMAADGSVIMSYGKFAHQPVPLNAVSPFIKKAVLATEDRRFYQHNGIDPLGILRAMFQNAEAGKIRQGGSTLSQQLARTLFLSNERSFSRKLKEAVLAIRIEEQLSKDEILALYLNNVYFGEGAYGIEAASRIYFNKPAKTVDISQAAILAGLVQAPSQYNPYVYPDNAKKRRSEVLQNMVEDGSLESKEAERLAKLPIKVYPAGRELSNPDKAPFFNRYVLKKVLATLNMDEKKFWTEGVKIYTTLDPKAQKVAEQQIRTVVFLTGRQNQEGALLSLDNHNRIIAYVGGQNFNRNQYDHISQARRPAGSLMKTLVYTTAVQKGVSPFKVYTDEPIQYGDWSPRNYDKRHRGDMTLAHALVKSNNVVAVQVLEEIGPQALIENARKFGIKAAMAPNLSLALGAVDVTLEEMTGVFSVFRNNGAYIEPYAIEKIVSKEGQVFYTHQSHSKTVLSRAVRDTMVSLLRGVLQYGTGRGANMGHAAAGKTGTSDDCRDAWFVAFTPEVTAGVWVGNDDNTKMAGVTGGTIPVRIWKNYMSAVLSGKPNHEFVLVEAQPLKREDFMRIPRTTVIAAEPSGLDTNERVFVKQAMVHQALDDTAENSEKHLTEEDSPGKDKKAWSRIKQELKKPWKQMKGKLKDHDD